VIASLKAGPKQEEFFGRTELALPQKIPTYPSICHTDNPQAFLLLFGHCKLSKLHPMAIEALCTYQTTP